MKNSFLPLIALLFMILVFLISSCSNNADSRDQEVETETTAPDQGVVKESRRIDLPQMPIRDMSGRRLVVSQLRGKIVLVLFQPECEDCQREAAQIQQNLQAFEDYSLYFISNADLQQQVRFAREHGLSGHPNVHFAQTSIDDIIYTLGPSPAPSLFIYSAEGQLVKSFKGETDIQEILAHL